MPTHRIVARPPKGAPAAAVRITDPDRLSSFLEDAAHVSGHAEALVVPASEAEIADALGGGLPVLPVGAQSSLTGGATPRGELLISTSRLNRIVHLGSGSVRVQAGVTLAELDAALAGAGRYYPPAPTFTGAFAGGTIATNAAGAATFKYGTTRDWVDALTVVLPCGEVIDLERGAVRAHDEGYFEIVTSAGAIRVPVPRYTMPAVPKVSAGYFAGPSMDLIDLFIGAEGTLGVVVEATLRVIPSRPAWCLAFVPFSDRQQGLAFVRRLRAAAQETWRTRDPNGLDVSAIEHLDARCLALAREEGADRRSGVTWPGETALAFLVTLELPSGTTAAQAFDDVGLAHGAAGLDRPIARFCRTLEEFGVLDHVEIAVPGDAARHAQLAALREAVPAIVNQRVGAARRLIDSRIQKTAADMIVPFDRFEDLLALYDSAFGRRGLDVAVWGHISDGNVHPNVLPRAFDDIEKGTEAIVEIGRGVVRMGGSPLAEHGVGRNAVKQQLLLELYGHEGVDQMRDVKRALDPRWILSPGVIFPRSSSLRVHP